MVAVVATIEVIIKWAVLSTNRNILTTLQLFGFEQNFVDFAGIPFHAHVENERCNAAKEDQAG